MQDMERYIFFQAMVPPSPPPPFSGMLFPVGGVGASPPSACNAGSCLHKTLPVSKFAQTSYLQSGVFFSPFVMGGTKY